jgi:hypothetical protein
MSKTLVEDGALVVEYFFDSKNPHSTRRSELSFTRSVLYQLLSHPRVEAAQAFKLLHEYRALSGTSTASSSEELHSFIVGLVQSLQAPYLLVDALDECGPLELESVLDQIQDLCEQCPSLRILLTSRGAPEIRQWFDKKFSALGQSLIVPKEVADEDVRKFLDTRIQKSRKLRHPWIQDEVRSKVIQKAEVCLSKSKSPNEVVLTNPYRACFSL